MEKMRMESVDLTALNIEKIGELFPNCITETVDENGHLKKAIKFDLLKQMLSGDVIEGDEAYEFTWVGKKAAIVEANKPIRKTLRPCPEESVDWDNTENLYIEGDNLEVLKLLQESYLGKVKMIYIDPPYNTGNDFIYSDDFMIESEEWKTEIGAIDDAGNRMFRNTDSNGRFHSDWCSMIYSRLMLSRNLLSDDGVVFISISETEIDNLKKMCMEVFGEKNYIASLVRKTKTTSNNGNQFAPSHEYIVVCAKKVETLNVFNDPEAQEDEDYVKLFKWEDEYSKYNVIGLYQPALKHGGSSYPIECPDGSFVVTPEGKPWRWNEQTFLKNKAENRVVFKETKTSPLLTLDGKKSKWNIYTKLYLKDRLASGMRPITFIDKYTNSEASKELIKMGIPFDFPKPRRLIQYLMKICLADNDSIILDFFSGSATTAHAVMQLNMEDGQNRRFIMVQLPEKTDEKSDASKAGYKNICDIGKERIRRAGRIIKEENPLTTQQLDIGFRVLKLADSNMNDVYYSPSEYSQDMLSMLVSNVKYDRNDLDLLFGCLLVWGLPLSLPYISEQIDGCTVHNYNDGDLIACFDENVPDSVIKEIAKRQPLRAVFRDSSFANSPSKINVGEIFKLMAPDTRVKVI